MIDIRQTATHLKFVVLVLLSLLLFSAHVQATEVRETKRDAQAWLKKIQSAAKKLNYSGTFVYQQANQIRTSRITHISDGVNEIEKLEILDGAPREYIRKNEEITCYMPETKTLFTETRVTPDVFPSLLAANPAALTEHYNVEKGESERIAGYDCQAIILSPKDNLRYGYKLWAEKSSGLLMRAQTLNENNKIVEQISFNHLQIGNIHPNQVKSSFVNTSGWRVENAIMQHVDLSAWQVKSVPPGFKKIREMKRLISDTPAQNGDADGGSSSKQPRQREVSQIVFSDGLAAISVFIEPGTHSRTEGSLQQGAMNIAGRRQGDFWLTIVGEVPSVAIKKVANSIEFQTR